MRKENTNDETCGSGGKQVKLSTSMVLSTLYILMLSKVSCYSYNYFPHKKMPWNIISPHVHKNKLERTYHMKASSSSDDGSKSSRFYSPSSNGYHSSQPNRDVFKTRIENAILIDCDPVPELDRRIAHGCEYEHWPEKVDVPLGDGKRYRKKGDETNDDHNIQKVKGTIASLRVTKEERHRLKSAHP